MPPPSLMLGVVAREDRKVRKMNGFKTPDEIRIHSEAPAEGDSTHEFPEIRAHSQDPAEGADDDGGRPA